MSRGLGDVYKRQERERERERAVNVFNPAFELRKMLLFFIRPTLHQYNISALNLIKRHQLLTVLAINLSRLAMDP